MKANYLFKLLLIIGLQIHTFFLYANSSGITIDQKKHALIAPVAGYCQWFKDNQLLSDEHSPELKITESGNYSVKIFDEAKCEPITYSITVAVDAQGAILRIFTIGDSTVQDYTAGYYPRKGWGQVLPLFFNSSQVQVINKAVGGTSSKSFYNNYWSAVRNSLAAGDYVFIQFGINDRNKADAARYTPTGGEFESYLTKYVNETRAKGAIPVLVTTVRRNAWNADGKTVYDSYHDHPVAVRTVAQNLHVPLIDLDAKAKVLMEKLGKTYTTRLWYNNYLAGEYPNYPNGNTDDVHFQEMGAIEMAKMVTEGISQLSSDPNLSKLIPFLKPLYEVKVFVNPVGADIATTRTTSYPQGLTITLKTLPKSGSTFQRWTNTSGATAGTGKIYTFTASATNTVYTAVYAGAVTTCTATITPSGPATVCQGDKLTLTASAGVTYVWKKDGQNVGTAATYSPVASGSYTVEVTNASNCKAVSNPVSVTIKTPSIWYADTDKDGKGDASQTLLSCTPPAGYVADNTDKCPGDAAKIIPGNCGCGKTEQSCLDCNGVPNGTATIDACSRCTGGNTGKVACTVSEAESVACSYDGGLESLNAGFKGQGYINTTNVKGASVTFSINAAVSGSALIGFRYACGSANDRPAMLRVNGVTLPSPLSFPSTGLFTTYKTVEASIPLQAGSNQLQLIATTAEGLVNIDEVLYLSSGASLGTCPVEAAKAGTVTANDVEIFPNPFDRVFNIIVTGDFNYSISDNSGKELIRGSGTDYTEINAELEPGIYNMKIQTKSFVKVVKVIRN